MPPPSIISYLWSVGFPDHVSSHLSFQTDIMPEHILGGRSELEIVK